LALIRNIKIVSQACLALASITVGNFKDVENTVSAYMNMSTASEDTTFVGIFACSLVLAHTLQDSETKAKAGLENLLSSVTAMTEPNEKMFGGVRSLYEYSLGNKKAALQIFYDMCKQGADKMSTNQILPMQLFGQLTIVPFLFISEITTLSEEDKIMLKEALEAAVNVADRLWRYPSAEGSATFTLYTCALHLLKGRTSEGLSELLKAYESRQTRQIVEKMKLYNAYHIAILARFSTKQQTKRMYLEQAKTYIPSINTHSLSRWAQGGNYTFSK
jgi:hypothetical protein